ncbi:MAG: methylated-DNA--[protein]-cysteine S-methyltransferase [Chitinophagales bacterium]
MDRILQQSFNFLSPVGNLHIFTEAEFIVSVSFTNDLKPANYSVENKLILESMHQLKAYFTGRLHAFDLPLNPKGTAFQKEVWNILKSIPYGETRSYATVAELAGGKQFTRAVGYANANNPIAVIIPCHRVIGSNGSLVGYTGGIRIKKWLLRHELQHKFGVIELFGPEN